MTEQRPDPKEVGFYFALAQVGLEMVLPAVGGLLVDIYGGTMPWGVLIGAVLGFVGGFYHLLLMVNQRDRTEAEKKKRESR